MIEIEVETPVVECAETVRGVVRWSDEEGKPPRAIEISLGYRTEGRGDPDRGGPPAIRHDTSGATQGEVPFELAAPADGPITYDGRLIRVIWSVTAELDRPMAKDESASSGVTVFPIGGHAVWARMAPPPT